MSSRGDKAMTDNPSGVRKGTRRVWPAPAMDDNAVYVLKSKDGRLIIDSPPLDAKCVTCGRHVSELPPFGGPGDPLEGDFRGAKMVQVFRAYWKPTETDTQVPIDALWLCRDCVMLDEDQLAEKISERPEVIESKRRDEAIEKEATGLLLATRPPRRTIGDPKSERNLPMYPYAHHYDDKEYYTYHLKDEVEGAQIKTLEAAGWELLFVRTNKIYRGRCLTGKLEIRFIRTRKNPITGRKEEGTDDAAARRQIGDVV